MYGPALQLLPPFVGITLNVIIQIILVRKQNRWSLPNSIYLGFLSGLIATGITDVALCIYDKVSLSYFVGIILTNLIIYSSLGYCYFHFIGLGETARRIRLLWEIYDSEGGLTTSELLMLYNAKEVLSYRIERLLKNKQILLQNDRYLIGNTTILWIANIIIFLKFMMLGKRSEFE